MDLGIADFVGMLICGLVFGGEWCFVPHKQRNDFDVCRWMVV